MSDYSITPLMARLEVLRDKNYADFNAVTIPGVEKTALGVRMPELRAIAKEIIRTDDWRDFLDASRQHVLFEFRMLHGMVLGGAKCDIKEKLALTDAFLPWVDNWGICDALCSSFKPRKGDHAPLFDFIRACAESDMEFRKRFGLVMMMSYFREEPWLHQVMEVYKHFHHEGYYARMGAAWGLATLWLFAREDALAILEQNLWDDFTHNKAIQKLRESFRVSDADKALVLTLKRKKAKA